MIDVLVAAVIALTSPALAPADDTTVVMEDSPQWDCTTMGNQVCGVGNAQGVPAGDYSQR
jgi:hypothetical protein